MRFSETPSTGPGSFSLLDERARESVIRKFHTDVAVSASVVLHSPRAPISDRLLLLAMDLTGRGCESGSAIAPAPISVHDLPVIRREIGGLIFNRVHVRNALLTHFRRAPLGWEETKQEQCFQGWTEKSALRA
jgi:hypothetical protein